MNQEQSAIEKAKSALESMGGKGDLSQADYHNLLQEHPQAALLAACRELGINIANS